jgi:hypothetical protein
LHTERFGEEPFKRNPQTGGRHERRYSFKFINAQGVSFAHPMVKAHSDQDPIS